MEKVKQYLFGILSFIIMIILLIIFMDKIFIFGAVYLILFIIAFLIDVFMIVKNNKHHEIMKKIIYIFFIIGLLSVMFGTKMISYGTRYIRYSFNVLFNKTNYALYYDQINIYNRSDHYKRVLSIESNKNCTEILNSDGDDINTLPCEVELSKNEELSLDFITKNYMGQIEYKINNQSWKNIKNDASNYTIRSDSINLFKKDYVKGNYHIKVYKKTLIKGENEIRIKYREKEEVFIFKYNSNNNSKTSNKTSE